MRVGLHTRIRYPDVVPKKCSPPFAKLHVRFEHQMHVLAYAYLRVFSPYVQRVIIWHCDREHALSINDYRRDHYILVLTLYAVKFPPQKRVTAREDSSHVTPSTSVVHRSVYELSFPVWRSSLRHQTRKHF